ncbi:FKBP-type peptidyl-prolyl cis-trans isomerase [Marivirga harenae]|uniref:FKBP-type peptidyl-prolyl cis-trans isomerase n=1 Tax=Marivirga harenae TaxID=2010992 RepID=UPI0026E02043|nr:FKBP-type peptidyl-prolyl cis-trans isomerase [Marivirga harenae]WKV13446.1 FKBP-type peptidyl-prolyl cis-trans isomerase [Marivirga harenae]
MKKILLLMMTGLVTVLFSSCEEECENTYGECPEEQLAEDVLLIEEYLEDNNLTAERLTSYDLFYIIEEQGAGGEPENGQNISVNYVGKFLNGKVFDTSIESVAKDAEIFSESRTYEPFSFTLGQRQVILGWDVGLKLINEGGKATLILPSYLAYGPRGSGSIPANEVLLFEVELVSINE